MSFERTENWNDVRDVSLQGYATISPAKLVETFGPPSESDGYKVSGEYMFVDKETGEAFTLYEYKSTSMYDDDLVSPKHFWASTEPFEFHIGGSDNTDNDKIKQAVEELAGVR